MWKSGNVDICVERFNRYLTKLGSLEMWKCGNMQLNGFIVNVLIKLGSLEMWKYALNGLIVNVPILVVWKCGNMR